jgi:hypothetical protein
MNRNASFARSFWIAFAMATVACLTGLHVAWRHDFRKLPAATAPPVWGKSYVALYDFGSDHGNIDYYLFRTGILGFRERINRADLLLFGSSHVQFGLSAAELGRKFSAAEGHPVTVFNAAISGAPLNVIADLVTANHLHDKPAVFDLFAMDTPAGPLPRYMAQASVSDLEAYLQVSKCWTEFWRDWLLDGLLPNLSIANSQRHARLVILKRFLKFTAIRDWQTGDAISLWLPQEGAIFPVYTRAGDAPINNQFRPYAASSNAGVGRHPDNAVLRTRHIQAIFTLLPFGGSDAGIVPTDARPYIPISPEGLFYWDNSHLSGRGRDAATEKLFEGMEEQGLRIDSAAGP